MIRLTTSVVATLLWCSVALGAGAGPQNDSGLFFAYTYGYPQTVENLEFIAEHLDYVVGPGHFQTKRVNEFQYDTMININEDLIIIVYTVIQAFTFEPMHDIFKEYAIDNTLDIETAYLHYYYDQVVKTRSQVTKTSGTGLPSDRVCDAAGTLLLDGASSNYYVQYGYGGGSATSIDQARFYQYWFAGWEPRMYHLGPVFAGAYPEYLKQAINIVDANGDDTSKYVSGAMLDTYQGIVDVDGYVPNMHQLIELRDAGYSTDDTAARHYYSNEVAKVLETARATVVADTGIDSFTFYGNMGDIGYWHTKYDFVIEDLNTEVELGSGGLETMISPSKSQDWTVSSYFWEHYEAGLRAATNNTFVFDQADTAFWAIYEDASLNDRVPPWEVIQFIVGGFNLFKSEGTVHGIHFGTPSPPGYGPGLHPFIGESKGGKFSDSHWHEFMGYNLGDAVVHNGTDLGGNVDSTGMYVVEYYKGPGYPVPGRYVLARDFQYGKVMIRFEKSDNLLPYDPNYGQVGEDPRTYQLNGNYCRLLPGLVQGPVISELTLGLSQGAMLTLEGVKGCGDSVPVCNWNEVQDDNETCIDGGNGVCPPCGVEPPPVDCDDVANCGIGVCPACVDPDPVCDDVVNECGGECPPCPIEPTEGPITGFFNYLGTTYLYE